METLESFIKFLSSYPMWAKLLVASNVVIIGCTLLLAPRSEAVGVPPNDPPAKQAFVLKITRVRLFPQSDTAEVKVTAFVNGTEYRYPSLAGVEWLRVGPSMAGQTFELPQADRYVIRFGMEKRNPAAHQASTAHLVSQETVTLTKAPFHGTYTLHGFDPESHTRSASSDADVDFSFEIAP